MTISTAEEITQESDLNKILVAVLLSLVTLVFVEVSQGSETDGNTIRSTSVYWDYRVGEGATGAKTIFTTPSDKTFVLTDIIVTPSSDDAHVDIKIYEDDALKIPLFGPSGQYHFNTGVPFSPGSVISVTQPAQGNTSLVNVTYGITISGYEAVPASSINLEWRTLGGGAWGADLVSDGETLYRVGGDFQCHSIYRYDGPSQNSWSLVTDENPQCYSHRSPGENNRSWYYKGKIVVAGHSHPLHPGGDNVTIYDLASGAWTVHELPVFDHFSWGQAGALNAFSGDAFILWTEDGTSHTYATSALDLSTGTWGPSYDRSYKIGQGPVALEDTSGQFVFDLVQGDRYVKLNIYDVRSQSADFSGTWRASSTLDLGPGESFMYLDRNYGSYVMAWDAAENKLYLVAAEKGTTLAYDPSQDSWQELDTRPEGQGYRDGHVAIAHGRLYSQTGDQLWYMPLR